MCWGGQEKSLKKYWTTTGVQFNPAEKLFGYGLKSNKDEMKNFLICLQAYLMKPLLYAENEKENKRYYFSLILKMKNNSHFM